jgi:hypothetical protein
MSPLNERNLGQQPLATIMESMGLDSHDLVAASTEQITHKMVSRAKKGRRLSIHVQQKIVNALNAATKEQFLIRDIFTY